MSNAPIRSAVSIASRGVALFIGAFSAANTAFALVGSGRSEDLWWIDLSALHPLLAAVLTSAAALLLLVYGILGAGGPMRRVATGVATATLATFAALNSVAFFRVAGSGEVFARTALPFSAVVAALLAGIVAALWLVEPMEGGRRVWTGAGVAAVALVCALAFPLAHVYFFGTTDYRAPADVAVVLGAKVHDNGALSWSLEDRVRTGVELYREGFVGALVMSGGVGENGIDETVAMKRRAVQLGVPEEDVYLDGHGINTDATVRNTSGMFADHGWRRILVVSQFYHLPRIKMAYRAAGIEVRTVPAMTTRVIPKTPLFVAREIGGFWVYWARSALRDVEAGPAQG